MKLDHAIQEFGLDVSGRVAIDVGCSTGILDRQIHTRTHMCVCMCLCVCMCVRAQCLHCHETHKHTHTHMYVCACALNVHTRVRSLYTQVGMIQPAHTCVRANGYGKCGKLFGPP